MANVFRAWAYITLLISFIDFILVILLAIDFRFCKHAYGVDSGVCVNIIIPVLVIAAKGFTLWIVNVSFAFALIITAKELAKVRNIDRDIPNPPISNLEARMRQHYGTASLLAPSRFEVKYCYKFLCFQQSTVQDRILT